MLVLSRVEHHALRQGIELEDAVDHEMHIAEQLRVSFPEVHAHIAESGLDRVIRASYELLGYMSFFTVGDDECRAWSIPRQTRAQDAAAEIHSDIARGFIRAEVIAYDAFIARGTMHAAREHGELRLEGKDYVVQDGDIINFRFAT